MSVFDKLTCTDYLPNISVLLESITNFLIFLCKEIDYKTFIHVLLLEKKIIYIFSWTMLLKFTFSIHTFFVFVCP